MIARDAQREVASGKLARHFLATGLGQTSLRQLAEAAGVSDRMLLYYFADKADIVVTVMERLAGELATRLSDGLAETPRLPPASLLRRAAALTTAPEVRPYMRLWIESVAAAARGEEPFPAITEAILAGFRHWLDLRLDLAPGADREAVAMAILATLDGLALIEICSGQTAVAGAVNALGALAGDGPG